MSDPFCGEVRMFAGSVAPTGWLLCDGAQVSVPTYSKLFSLIGTTYGGDGESTFGLPNLCGTVPIGTGQRTGAQNYVLGQTGGTEEVTLTSDHLPSHNHAVSVTSAQATSLTPDSSLAMGAVDATLHLYTDTSQGVNGVRLFSTAAISTSSGSDQPHSNMMPTMTMNFIICWNGLYPNVSG